MSGETVNHRRVGNELVREEYPDGDVEGPPLGELGVTVEGADDTVLGATEREYDGLRVGEVVVEPADGALELRVVPRYKPEDDSRDTDTFGYVSGEPVPAVRVDRTELDPVEEQLLRAFVPRVPTAAKEQPGYAGFRREATKTISLLDRVREMRIPRADALDEEFERRLDPRVEREGSSNAGGVLRDLEVTTLALGTAVAFVFGALGFVVPPAGPILAALASAWVIGVVTLKRRHGEFVFGDALVYTPISLLLGGGPASLAWALRPSVSGSPVEALVLAAVFTGIQVVVGTLFVVATAIGTD